MPSLAEQSPSHHHHIHNINTNTNEAPACTPRLDQHSARPPSVSCAVASNDFSSRSCRIPSSTPHASFSTSEVLNSLKETRLTKRAATSACAQRPFIPRLPLREMRDSKQGVSAPKATALTQPSANAEPPAARPLSQYDMDELALQEALEALVSYTKTRLYEEQMHGIPAMLEAMALATEQRKEQLRVATALNEGEQTMRARANNQPKTDHSSDALLGPGSLLRLLLTMTRLDRVSLPPLLTARFSVPIRNGLSCFAKASVTSAHVREWAASSPTVAFVSAFFLGVLDTTLLLTCVYMTASTLTLLSADGLWEAGEAAKASTLASNSTSSTLDFPFSMTVPQFLLPFAMLLIAVRALISAVPSPRG